MKKKATAKSRALSEATMRPNPKVAAKVERAKAKAAAAAADAEAKVVAEAAKKVAAEREKAVAAAQAEAAAAAAAVARRGRWRLLAGRLQLRKQQLRFLEWHKRVSEDEAAAWLAEVSPLTPRWFI